VRVAHVITRLIVGGAQENTLSTVLGLARRPDLQVRLFSGPTTGPEGSLEAVARQTPGLLTLVPSLVRPVSPWRDLQAFRSLCREFRFWRPDLVHTHSGKAGVLGRLAAKRAGVPIIVHTIHGPSFGPFQGPLANAVYTAMEQWAGRVTTHFVSVAEAMSRQYLAAGIGQPAQYSRVWSGFELRSYLEAVNSPGLRARYGLAPEHVVIGTIARLFELKGHDDILAVAPELVRRCPAVRFLWVGDGAWRGRFEEKIRAAGLERYVVLTGLVPPGEVPALTGIMDLLVHLSRREGLARALPQAMAAGKPIMAYDCDGAGEVCLDGQTGFLVECGDHRGLVERLVMLAGDAALRSRLGARGRELSQEWFPVEKMIEDLGRLYARLAERRSLRGE